MTIRNRKVTLAEVRTKGLDAVVAELENRSRNQNAIMAREDRPVPKPNYAGAAEIAEQKYREARKQADTPTYAPAELPDTVVFPYGTEAQKRELTDLAGVLEQQKKALEKERDARAKSDYYRQKAQEQKDEEILQTDLEELDRWPEEDREALKTYIIERGYEFGANPMYSAGTARANATKLFEKYGAKKVEELAESYGRWENARNAEEIAELGTRMAESGGLGDTLGTIGANIVSVGANMAGAVTGAAGYLKELTQRTGRYSTLDPNNAGQVFGTWSGAVRQKTAENLEAGTTGKVGSTVYQGAMSAADSLTRALTLGPAGAATLAATDSAARTISEASRQGASPAQAVTLGIATAGIEYLTEKLPLERLFKAAKGGAKGAGAFIKEVLKQGGIEAATEEISLLGSMAAEAVILGEKDSSRQRIGDLVANGMSYREAQEQVNRENWEEAVQTFAVSFTAGAFGAGTGQVLGNRANPQEAKPRVQQTQETQPQAVQAEPEAVQTEPKTAQQRLMETMAPIAQNAPKAQTDPETERASQVAQGMLSGIVSPQTVDTQEQSTNGGQRQVEQWERDNVEGIRQVIRDIESGMSQQELREKSRQYEAEYERLQSGGTDGERKTAHFLYSAYDSAAKNPQATAQMYRNAMPQLEADIGIKGTGAAERGFTPKQAMINEYGNIPEGENPVRADQMPISTDGTDRVSYTSRTATEARVTPDEFVPLIENETVNQGFSYIPITNDQTVQRATAQIASEGWETARVNWTAAVRNGQAGADITATGAILYNHAVNAGDFQEAMEILLDYQRAVRNSAQALQAARILKTLTPSDRLWMIRRSIDRMVQDMHLQTPITINEELAREYQTATDERADEILDEIAADVARQIPRTFGEMFTAIRYLNMLGNLRTQVRNVSGNVGAGLVYRIKDQIGATMEDILAATTGGRYERTKSHWVDSGTYRAAAADFENVRDWLLDGGRYNDRGTESEDFARRVEENRRILPRGLEEYRRATNWAMNNDYFGDAAFGRTAYARALAGYLNARGIRTDNLDAVDRATMDRAREYAVRQAQEATFRDNNQISTFVSQALRGPNTPAWVRVLGEGLMPFRKTPANVLVRAEEFSPLGLLNSAYLTAQRAAGNTNLTQMRGALGDFARAGQDITGNDLVDSWAKTLTGSALFILGMALHNMGALVGGPDPDEDKAEFDALNGIQDYALMFPDGTNITIDWLSPSAMPMFMGAQLDTILNAEQPADWDDLERMFTSLADPMVQMSMLQGLNDTLDNVKYADDNLGQFLLNTATAYLTQGLSNTLLGRIERSTEGARMTTYVDENGKLPKWAQRQLGKLSQKVPGWDYQQTPYINAYGQEEEQWTDAAGWLYNLVFPGYVDKKQVDALAEEMYRLNETGAYDGNVFITSPTTTLSYTDKNGEKHKDYQMTMEEADTLKRVTGQTATDMLNAAIKNPAYKAMTDAQKAKVFEYVYDYAREKGRSAALKGYDGMAEWMKEVGGKDPAVIIRRVANAAMDDSISGSDAQELSQAYKVYQGMSDAQRTAFREDAAGRVKYYLEAKEAGIKESAFLNLYSKYRAIDGNGKKASQKANEWALALDKARQNGTITREQAEALKTSMVYRTSLTADPGKYDEMVSTGVKPETAYDVSQLLAGIEPYEGSDTVKPVQKYEAIAESKYTDAEKDLIMKAYMPDYDPTDKSPDKTELKYDTVRDLGYSPEEYAEIYAAYLDADKKAQKIAAIQKLGYSYSQAQMLYSIFCGTYFKGK